MKREWQSPKLNDLSLKETKGGVVYDPKADGDAVWDTDTQKWWTPSGHS